MPKTDAYEAQLFVAYDKGALQSTARKSELSKFKAAANAAAAWDQRVNIPLSSGDLQDIQAKGLEGRLR